MSAEGGLFSSLTNGRYKESSNFDPYLKRHAGDTIKVDRIGRTHNYVKSPSLSMILCIQPFILSGLMNNHLLKGNGFLGRFLYVKCGSEIGKRNVNPPSVPEKIKSAYHDLIINMLKNLTAR